jgi:hypothetical protein
VHRCANPDPTFDRKTSVAMNPRSPSPDPTTPARRSLLRQSVAIVATVACVVLGTTACGAKSAGPGVAQLMATESISASGSPVDGSASHTSPPASSGSAKGVASALAHSECMRSHGVPDFPDPGPLRIDVRTHPDLDPSSPPFVAAQKACLSLAPGGTAGGTVSAQQQAAALAYSACMRAHGFPKFPDPVFSDGGEHVTINGINMGSAQFQNADKACQTSTGLGGLPSGGSGP